MMQGQPKKLGFGLMRLPVTDGDPTHIDMDQVCRMVDCFLERGFTYFDTSRVYHNGMSEDAVRRALVERHPRDSFTLADKLPTFAITEKAQVEGFFAQSIEQSGAGYFDYYLLHNMNGMLYDGAVKEFGMFEAMQAWKAQGKIRHIGFSFHDDAETLDRILTEHPEVEFVQICVNYLDWEHWSVQARKCYETIRKHGKQVVIMEAVKGGTLASLPADAAALLQQKAPGRSPAEWSIRFGAGLDGVLVALSGMSTLAQVEENTGFMQDFQPLTDEEYGVLAKAAALLDSRMKYPLSNAAQQRDICPQGIRVADFIQYYNEATQEADVSFSAELNYYKLLKARSAPIAACDGCGKCAGLCPGKDVPAALREAEAFFEKYGF